MENQFYILLIICFMCHLFRIVYEILKNRELLNSYKKIVFIFMAFNMTLLWVSWFMMSESPQPELPGCIYMKYAGLFIFLAGLVLFILPLMKMKKIDGYRGDLIQTGIFSKLRHPMYLGFICWIIGYPIFMKAKFSLLSAMIFIPSILFIRYMEEKRLMQRYDDYEEYKRKTWF